MPKLSREQQEELRNSLSRLLSDHSTEQDVRKTMETDSGYDSVLWQRLAEMGIVGLLVDEQYGGFAAGPVAIENVMEEAGAALLCSPLLASGVVAAAIVETSGDDEAKGRLLPDIATGKSIATVALTGAQGCWTSAGVEVEADDKGGAWTLRGNASYVIHAQNADVLLVVANAAGGQGLFEVAQGSKGLAIEPLATFDHTLRLAALTFDGTPATLIGDGKGAWSAAESALDLALVALAGEQAGGARKVLDMTVEYAKNRVQFGRAIGSFQAIKHMAADLLLESESAISAARHAAQALDEGTEDRDASISLAAFACADAFSAVTAASIQMHGGIGFTWEHPAHLYLRRARADAQLFGSPVYHRERYIQQLGG